MVLLFGKSKHINVNSSYNLWCYLESQNIIIMEGEGEPHYQLHGCRYSKVMTNKCVLLGGLLLRAAP